MWPRDIAAKITAEPSRERRREMLAAVAPEMRKLVRAHVEDAFFRKKKG